jgi:hypothetical protein
MLDSTLIEKLGLAVRSFLKHCLLAAACNRSLWKTTFNLCVLGSIFLSFVLMALIRRLFNYGLSIAFHPPTTRS